MDPQALKSAAAIIAAGRLDRTRMGPLPAAVRPSAEAEGYDLQRAVRGELTLGGYGEPVGHKIGCTTPVMQRFLGIPNPCAGAVYAPTVREIDGTFNYGSFLHVGVECEVAVRLGLDLADTAEIYTRHSVEHAVESVMAGIEVVDDRWDDYGSIDVATLIADDFFGAGCVLGEPVTDWRSLDLAALHGAMSINGSPVGSGIGGDIMGHPLEALAWLANNAARRGHLLRAGEFVFLGSIVETRWIKRGDVVVIDVDGLGAATARFA